MSAVRGDGVRGVDPIALDHLDERTSRGAELGDPARPFPSASASGRIRHPDVRAVRGDGVRIVELVSRSLDHLDERTRRGAEFGDPANAVDHPDVRAVRSYGAAIVELVARGDDILDERTRRGMKRSEERRVGK